MKKELQIRCKNNEKKINLPIGCTLYEAYETLNLRMPHGPVSAKVNNKVEGLHYRCYNNKDVEFLDVTSASGMRTYTRSLFFVLVKAVEELFPDSLLRIQTPVSRGYYCQLRIGRPVEEEDVKRIRTKMREIVAADIPFRRIQSPTDEAISMFRARGMESKARLLESSGSIYTFYYKLEDTVDYFYGSLLTSTGGLKVFDLVKYYDGLLLRLPARQDPSRLDEMVRQDKMLEIFREHHNWQEILGVTTVGDFNVACQSGLATQLINVSEALQEKKIVSIAEEIYARPDVKLVLIAGPSSSGKTTFSKRLAIQLMACGLKPYSISLDDYFVNREDTPRDANGEYDFESIHALDIPYFNRQLETLLSGEEVELPRFNFQTGQREASGKHLRIDNHTILILEGIHALNPELTPHIPSENKFKVYVSALTTILLDDHNYIPTTDNRLLRRIIRDYKYRGYSALDTIRRWPSVRAGEDKWIFPYQEEADMMFNSALLFELAVLRDEVLPVLEQVPEREPEYSEAYRLRKFLRYFVPLRDKEIPPTSLLREFLGGSSFEY
ncbi:MAG: nucleoside kinase [Paraprevotella sp.]|nr:nucleoside kinase [Paraprevotella sp.]